MKSKSKGYNIFDKKLRELSLTYGASSMGTALILMFDSIIAGLLLGTKALTAIGLMTPFLLIDEYSVVLS